MGVDLYTWYHQVKKKDLGEAKENWLQHLQEQALSKKKAQKQQKDQVVSPGNFFTTRDGSGLRDAASGSVSTRNSKCSTPCTPEKQIKSPFSALLDSSFITPTLVLSHEDDETMETTHRSSPYTPCELGLDLFSPINSKANTSVGVAASLGANLNDSLASWTSALATPLTTGANGQSPTTLERLTLHPKQGLRQKVMVRSLFSPRTPGTSTHMDGSPNLGIIKCYSPIPMFKNRAVSQQQRPIPDNSDYPLIGDTQSFTVCNKESSNEERKQAFLEGSVSAQNGIGSDEDGETVQKTKGAILHCGTDVSFASSQEESLGCCKLENNARQGESAQDSESLAFISATPTNEDIRKEKESGNKMRRSSDGCPKSGEETIMLDRPQAQGEGSQRSPFDLICSPVKRKNTGKNITKHEKSNLEDTCSTSGHKVEDQALLCDGRIETDSYTEQMKYSCMDYEKKKLPMVCEATVSKGNICDDSTLEELNTKATKPELPKTLPVPLFKKETKVIEEISMKDEEPVGKTITEGYTHTPNSKDVLKKLSVHKNKRLSGKFLYPRKSEAGYEKLNVKYQECMDDAQSVAVEADTEKESVSLESKSAEKSGGIHDIANRQQNFVSLTTLEKDDRLGLEKTLITNETTCRAGTSLNAQYGKRSQEEVVKQESPKPKMFLEELSGEKGRDTIPPSKEVAKATNFVKMNMSDNERSKFDQPRSEECQTSIELQVVPQKDLKSVRAAIEHSRDTGTIEAERFELPLSQSLMSEASEVMNDSFNDIDFAEIDWNFCVPNTKTEADHTSGKNLVDNHDLKVDSEGTRKETKSFGGFSTGRGKLVKVSEKALQQAKKLLEDTLEEKYVQDEGSHKEEIPANYNSVYKTTGKTSIGLIRKPVSSNFEKPYYFTETDAKIEGFSVDANFCSFSTGQDKPVKVGEQGMQDTEVLEVAKDLGLHSHQGEAASSVSENLSSHKAYQVACLGKSSKELTSSANLVQGGNIGFKTARGTNIVVNTETLNKVKRLWAEELELEEQEVKKANVIDNTEFGFEDSKAVCDSNAQLQNNLQIVNANRGFATAAGKAITVSEKALKKAQDLMEESSEEAKPHYISKSDSTEDTRQVSMEGKEDERTQNHRNETVSSNTLAPKNEARDVMNSENYQRSKTGTGSKISLSRSSIPKSHKLLGEIEEQFADVNANCKGGKLSSAQIKGTAMTGECEHPQKFKGFSTARGTKVRISDAALLRARKLWEENEAISEPGDLPDAKTGNTLPSTVLSKSSENQSKDSEKMLDSNEMAVASSSHNFLGFCTGRGKQVEISKEAVARARNFFEDFETSKEENIYNSTAEDRELEPKFKDFSRRNLDVTGSHEVGNTSSALMTKEKSVGERAVHKFIQSFDSHCGFITGRGENVKVAEKTLERVSKMFMDENRLLEHCGTQIGEDGKTAGKSILESKTSNKLTRMDKNNMGNMVLLEMEGENPSNRLKVAENGEGYVEEIIDIPNKEQQCIDEDEKERTPSPILGSQKTTRAMALDRRVPSYSGKRKFTELDPEKPNVRPTNKRLSLGNSKNTNEIPKKSTTKLGRRGHSQSALVSHKMHSSPAAKSKSQPTFLAPNSHPPPLQSHTKAQDSLQTQGKIIAMPDTQEICAITEAFLEDDLREGEGSLESFDRKRSREAEGTDRPSSKKFKDGVPQMPCSQMEDTETYAADEVVESGREMARLKQAKVARYKEKRPVPPIQGFLHRIRNDKKHSRIKMQSLGPLKVNGNLSWKVASINANNARIYRFPIKDRSCETVTCEDSCILVPSTDGFIGVEEVERGFLATPGVHPGLLPPGWVANHYRWIVWKLAALERRLLHRHLLTLENVVARLKYRYDREIDRAERPVLRKIMEHDDVPQKTMILCVAGVKTTAETALAVDGAAEARPCSPNVAPGTTLELTDGWYSIGAQIDTALSRFVSEEKVKVGTKLVIHGAEMAKHSPPCHPLQASPSVCLRLHANMTRRAKWWSRLGLTSQSGPLPTQIRGIQGDGGLVGRLTVLLARVYPPLYFEKTGGKSVFRSERAHDRLLRENQHERERNMHQVLAEVEREFDSQAVSQRQSKKTSSLLRNEEIRNLTSGKDIAELLEEALDPSSLEGLLSAHQIELARSWRMREAEERKRLINLEVHRRLAKKQRLYEAVTILKMRIVDTEGESAVVTIWRPTEEIRQALTEGTVFSVHYLCANGHKYGDLQLTATRQTRWERLTSPNLSDFQDVTREVTPLCLTSTGELAPLWREVDVVGIVLRISSQETGFQLVHLIDHRVNIVALKFWGGLKECGMEDMVQVGALLCVSNGSWRGHSGGRFGCIHITELTAVTTQPRRPHLEEQALHIKKNVKNMKTLLNEGSMKLDGQFDDRAFPEGGTSPAHPQSKLGRDTLENGQRSNVAQSAQGEAEIDHKESTPSTGLSRLQQRSREIRSKFKALGSYGTPSALRALKSPASRGAHKPFRMPFRQPLDLAKDN